MPMQIVLGTGRIHSKETSYHFCVTHVPE
jgi:hypothetical protein